MFSGSRNISDPEGDTDPKPGLGWLAQQTIFEIFPYRKILKMCWCIYTSPACAIVTRVKSGKSFIFRNATYTCRIP
jgi:hypothetical protein